VIDPGEFLNKKIAIFAQAGGRKIIARFMLQYFL
jgi:hypothetical protein